MPMLDPEQKQKLEAALILKATEVVGHMKRFAEAGGAEQVEKLFEGLGKLVKSKEFPTSHSRQFEDIAKVIVCAAYELSVAQRLHEAEEKARTGDEKARNEMLTKAKEHFGKALRFGADAEFRAGVERRVQAVLLTTKEGVDERTKQAALRKEQQEAAAAGKAFNGVEHRRARRYGDPALDVVIDGKRYVTVNWSTRGLLLEPYRPEANLYKGLKIKMDIHCEGLEGGGRQFGRIVRVDEARGIAVDFGEISTLILDLMHHMRETGMQPEPER